MLHGLVQYYGFVDGNKRTALLVADLMIMRSGYVLEIALSERFDDIIVDVASGTMSFEELADWFEGRIQKI